MPFTGYQMARALEATSFIAASACTSHREAPAGPHPRSCPVSRGSASWPPRPSRSRAILLSYVLVCVCPGTLAT